MQIIKSYRKSGKVRQKIVASLGCLQTLKEKGELEKIARGLLKFIEEEKTLYDTSTLKEIARYNWGAVAVFKKIWNLFDLENLLLALKGGRKIEFDYFSTIFLMLVDRIIFPSSKLRSYNTQDKYIGIKRCDLHHLYRSLDILALNKERIEEALFERSKSLFNLGVDVVFFDTTTFYFESQKTSKLKDFGFSKDLKVGEVQVLFSLIIDKEGRPVGFEVHKGSTFEGLSVKEAISKLKKRFNIEKLIFIGDRAIFSKTTFKYLKEASYEYIISSRIKNKSQKLTPEILNDSWASIAKDGSFKYKELTSHGNRLIITYSEKRAKRDKKTRERLVQKAKELLEARKVTSKGGARKYLKVGAKEAYLDEAKIKADARFDGFYGLETNNPDLTAEQVVEKYQELWKIEESFKIFKNFLETRPMFHYTDERIKGHFVLCFLAFLLERTLELELKNKNLSYSTQNIKDILVSLEVSEITLEGRKLFLETQRFPKKLRNS